MIATSLASIPALVYRREGDNRVEALGHPLYRLVRQGVNEAMTWPDFLEHLIVSTLLTGNGLAEAQPVLAHSTAACLVLLYAARGAA